MKRLWKTSFLFVLALTMILPLSGCNFGSSPIPDPPPKLSIPLNKLNVDWDKAIADAIEKVNAAVENDSEAIFSPSNIDVIVSEKSIIFDVEMGYYNNSYLMLCTMNYILRALNSSAKEQDNRIIDYDHNTYGGIYDIADLQVKMYGKDGEVFIDDTLSAGEHRKRGLHLLGNFPSVDWSKCEIQIKELYLSGYNPDILAVQFAHFSNRNDENLIVLRVAAKKGLSQQRVKAATLAVMDTFSQLCQRQDPSITNFSEDSYDGIYSYASLFLWVFEAESLENAALTKDSTRYYMWLQPGEYKDLDKNTEFHLEYTEEKMTEWQNKDV